MSKRESKWTSIYMDPSPEGNWYIRLTPDFMDLEAAGFPHGVSVTGNKFRLEEDAEKMADRIDIFMNKMIEDLKDE